MELSSLQERFLDALFDDDVQGSLMKAAAKAGYNSPDKNCYRVARALRDQIIERTKDYIATNAPKAATAISGILDGTPAPGAKERLLASKELLDRCGVVKSEEIKVDAPGVIFILPAKQTNDDEEE